MGVNSRILLQYRGMGFHNGEVYITVGNRDVCVCCGETAQLVYESLQRFVHQVREGGSGDFYEQRTGSGVQWREKL
jgi:hypothetical protein